MKYWEVTQELDDAELRWKPPNVQAKTRNIEATSYVLLTYATINNVTSGLQVIKWLVKQRNPNGGFGSTQVRSSRTLTFSLWHTYDIDLFDIVQSRFE